MAKVLFQIIGGLTLFYSAALLSVVVFVPRFSALRTTVADYGLLVVFVGVGAVLGIGLLYVRRWAAVGVSILALFPAFWCVLTALHPIPGNANWLGFVFALPLVSPAIFTAIYWNTLTSKR
jgi:hypothetical protein